MNNVVLIGRLTRDPEVRYTSETQMAVASFLRKGRLVGIQGRIQTGRYTNKNGDTVYTTEVVANNVEFLDWGDRNERSERPAAQSSQKEDMGIPDGFQAIEDEDIQF